VSEHRAFIDGNNNLWVDCSIIGEDGKRTLIGPVVSEEELAALTREHDALKGVPPHASDSDTRPKGGDAKQGSTRE
jgi:hypothetical protein